MTATVTQRRAHAMRRTLEGGGGWTHDRDDFVRPMSHVITPQETALEKLLAAVKDAKAARKARTAN